MNKKQRVSHEQKQLMLNFMLANEDLARGRIVGPEGSRQKAARLEELAALLNDVKCGASKTPEKWWKCWQDWRCDTKSKASRIKKYNSGSGEGPSPAQLTQLEDSLIQFCGVDMVQGVEEVLDPLDHETEFVAMSEKNIEAGFDKAPVAEELEVSFEPERQGKSNRHKIDPLQLTLERQAVALERLSEGMQDLSQALNSGMQDIAAALRCVAAAIEQQPVAVISDH